MLLSVEDEEDTARAISSVGIRVTPVADPKISDEIIGLMDILGSRFSLQNTELVDINHMRR